MLRYWKIFLVVFTIVFVVFFQSYWLLNAYENQKNEILTQISLEVQRVLTNELIIQNTSRVDEVFDDEIKSVIRDKLSDIINVHSLSELGGELMITVDGEDDEGDKVVYSNKNHREVVQFDSLIYGEVQSYIQKTYKDAKFVVYFEYENELKTYPKNSVIQSANTTESIKSLSSPLYSVRVHVVNLPSVILEKMYDKILFSVLYIVLFLSTVFLLNYNVKINRRLLKNKEIFTRNVTHELKIPISTIMIAAEAFEKYDLVKEPKAAKKYIHTIKRASEQLSFFVDSILQHAKAENGGEKMEVINLLELLEEVKTSLSQIIHEKKVSILFENIPKDLCIQGDFSAMKQVFLNLFDNSIKYSVESPKIIVKAERAKDRVVLKVIDNGIGIPKDHLEDVFSAYFRVANKDVYDVKGYGLGLSFVKSTLKNQNGHVRIVESSPLGTIIELNIAANV
ncbi:MAG TPA: HAMP domain-containing sensor histidine kinase [Moheibacter sp.]|nr:HAMP domain-containing sensor histidine kinase [Moheibacter sp.]